MCSAVAADVEYESEEPAEQVATDAGLSDQQVQSQLRDKHLSKIKKAEDECDMLESVYRDAQTAAKEAKQAYEAAVLGLRSIIRKGPNPQLDLPLTAESEDTDESWKDIPITTAMRLTKSQAEKLADAGVRTVYEFEQLRAGSLRDYPGGLSDLPRVGQATIDDWEDQIVEFWDRRTSIQLASTPVLESIETDQEVPTE